MFQLETFPGQEPDEKILMTLHRHWFVFFGKIILFLGLVILPFGIGLIWKFVSSAQLDRTSLGYALIVMGGGLYYLFIWMLLFGFWLDYYLDYFLVTDRRVVDVEQSGLFDRSIAELRLYRIQDVTSEVKGFWPTILRFGDVYIQTAGKEERFIFEQVAHPEVVVKTLLRLTDKIDDQVEHPDETKITPPGGRPIQQR